MKKGLIFFAIVAIIITVVLVKYSSYIAEKNAIKVENAEYEQYKDKEVYGLDVATMINKIVDKNTKNNIEKDENGLFVQNDTNSIELEIYMIDNEKTYKMETIYNGGTNEFVQYYGNIKFKCSKIEYHKNTGKIKYILFEQLQSS